MKKLSDLTGEELKTFLNSFDDVLFDCDGVIYIKKSMIEGVAETLSKLKQCGKRIRFVSNNSNGGAEGLCKKISCPLFQTQADDLVYPTLTIVDYLKGINFDKDIFLFGSETMKKDFRAAGFSVLETAPIIVDQSCESLIDIIRNDGNVGAVVVDMDVNFNYINIVQAQVYLRNPDVLFIVGATDKNITFGLDIYILGPGYFQDILAEASGRAPMVFAKPSQRYSEFVMKKFQIANPARTLFVGDALEQDMRFAHDNGFQKLLTLTGATSLETLQSCTDEALIPNFYIDSLGDLHTLIKNKLVM